MREAPVSRQIVRDQLREREHPVLYRDLCAPAGEVQSGTWRRPRARLEDYLSYILRWKIQPDVLRLDLDPVLR